MALEVYSGNIYDLKIDADTGEVQMRFLNTYQPGDPDPISFQPDKIATITRAPDGTTSVTVQPFPLVTP